MHHQICSQLCCRWEVWCWARSIQPELQISYSSLEGVTHATDFFHRSNKMNTPIFSQEFLRWKDAIGAEATSLHCIGCFFWPELMCGTHQRADPRTLEALCISLSALHSTYMLNIPPWARIVLGSFSISLQPSAPLDPTEIVPLNYSYPSCN